MNNTYSKEQIIDCLIGEFYLLQESDDDGELGSVEDYTSYLKTLTMEQLIAETSCDDEVLTLDDFIYAFS